MLLFNITRFFSIGYIGEVCSNKRFDGVKSIFFRCTRTIVNFDSILLQGMFVKLCLSYFYLFRTVLKIGHWKGNPRTIRIRFRLKQISRK